MLRRVALLALAAGCNWVYGIDDTVTQDAGNGSMCDPLPFDPARYKIGTSDDRSWQGSREWCQTFGMDLAVIDVGDSAEIANELNAADLPSWWGLSWGGSDWLTVDGCPPVLQWSPTFPMAPAPGQCVLGAPTDSSGIEAGMQNEACSAVIWGNSGAEIDVMCETPRPSNACRAQLGQRDYVLIPGTATEEMAEAMCAAMGRHVVEIDSTAELDAVRTGVGHDLTSFWIGATRPQTGWISPTSCPQVFIWSSGEPSAYPCVIYDSSGMKATDCTSTTASVICELSSP